MENQLDDLPQNVRRVLNDFIGVAKDACGSNLQSIVLFGSAAEGRLRPTSDVNLLLMLNSFELTEVNRLRDALRTAHAAIRLQVMFILQSEIELASEAFAVKFSDILSRHRILYGANPFSTLVISRSATVQRLRQVVINLLLRTRERYALVSLREEQLVPLIADLAGPLRSCASTILALEGQKALHPKEALQRFTQKLGGRDWSSTLQHISTAREEQVLMPGEAVATLVGIIELLQRMHESIQGLK